MDYAGPNLVQLACLLQKTSQTALAEKTGINKTIINRIAKCYEIPRYSQMEAIASAMHIPARFLFPERGQVRACAHRLVDLFIEG